MRLPSTSWPELEHRPKDQPWRLAGKSIHLAAGRYSAGCCCLPADASSSLRSGSIPASIRRPSSRAHKGWTDPEGKSKWGSLTPTGPSKPHLATPPTPGPECEGAGAPPDLSFPAPRRGTSLPAACSSLRAGAGGRLY